MGDEFEILDFPFWEFKNWILKITFTP